MSDFHSEKRRTAELLKELRENSNAEDESGGNPKLTWMYKGPEGHLDTEDYLLGRSVDKAFETFKLGAGADASSLDIPAPIVPREKNGVPSVQVDLAKKLHEDPLLRIKMEEDERRRALLSHPILVKKIAAMKAAQSKTAEKDHKAGKKRKSKRSSSESSGEEDLDAKLAAKLNQLRKNKDSKEADLDNQLLSKLSALRGNEKKETASKKVKESGIVKEKRKRSKSRSPRRRRSRSRSRSPRRRHNHGQERNERRRSRSPGPPRNRSKNDPTPQKTTSKTATTSEPKQQPRGGVRSTQLTGEELERRRQEMMANAGVRDKQRMQNVQRLNEEEKKEEESLQGQAGKPDFVRKQLIDAANTGTVEERIKANMFKNQRSHRSMDSNFARR